MSVASHHFFFFLFFSLSPSSVPLHTLFSLAFSLLLLLLHARKSRFGFPCWLRAGRLNCPNVVLSLGSCRRRPLSTRK
ncbi:hypothetical protein B0T16DRAFT_157698 [Cercophora newfieldiana]|uniref:Uncharacterized protein n=1 Tax=Cercophora newfieldiana TaxID=92897 RepID=A0AA40CPH9_9PEZI|nr:hypothetical protein B0T16DRAFT_157698 [Cercophora newfieldiana]